MPSENSIHIPYRLDGKVALVTGSGRGIGAAAAIELGRCGAKVVVNHSKSAAPALQVVEEIKKLGSDAVAIQANVSQVSEIERLFDEAVQHYGRLDIACSNAWVVSFGHLEEVTEVAICKVELLCSRPLTCLQEEFDRVFTLNTRAQFFVAREAYKHLNPGGRVILMSSNTKREFAVPKHSVYSGSKAAIESFVRVMALDAGKKQITVNAVASGGTVTDMFYDVARQYIPDGEKLNMNQIKGVSTNRAY